MSAPPLSGAPRVLVIDDDVTVRVLMRGALRKAGFDVVLAAGGREGLDRFGEQPADMVLLDVDMPDMSGMDVCRDLRRQAGELLPIVMVTGMDDVGSVEEAYRNGATDFIAKPIHWALFGHRIQYMMRSARAMVDAQATHAQNAALLASFPDLLARIDADGKVLELRRGSAAQDDDPDRVKVGDTISQRLPPPEAQRMRQALQQVLATGQACDIEFALAAHTGAGAHYQARIARIDPTQALCVVRDITLQNRAQAALQRSERRLEQAQKMARLGSWQIVLPDLRLEHSAETVRIFGMEALPSITHADVLARIHPDDRDRLQQAAREALRACQSYSCEYRIEVDGRQLWIHEIGEVEAGENGRARGLYGTIQDVTDRKEADERIARLAYFDSLTGMPNRLSFIERLGREVRRAEADGGRLALLFMDLDGFKAVNDTLGHHCGDRLLQQAADRLRRLMRPGDMIGRPGEADATLDLARLGGDEFTALLNGLRRPEDALGVGQRILEALRTPFDIDGRELTLSASVGIAVYPEDGRSGEELLKHADTAMYHAKELGRDNCQFYSSTLTLQALERMNMARDLRVALEEGQFSLAFQPQVDALTGLVRGIEALIRWEHPEQGPISPGAFIALAEANGMIIPIGRWVLQQACRQASQWQRPDRPLRLAVNLSPVQLRDAELVPTVMQALADSGLKPDQLELEVTEGALMADNPASKAALDELHEAGVRFALDDFGTGYSSMGYLKRLPVDMLKIDRSFVRGLPQDRDNGAIVRAIISLAHTLGFAVTAEGVETAEQAAMLGKIGCNQLQGFHFGAPMRPAEFSAWLSRQEGRRPALQGADMVAFGAYVAPG